MEIRTPQQEEDSHCYHQYRNISHPQSMPRPKSNEDTFVLSIRQLNTTDLSHQGRPPPTKHQIYHNRRPLRGAYRLYILCKSQTFSHLSN
ncbi:hypothetical protein L484_016613 [Morus notabilis]|uniref:Uncharacterized protein n=1 Tax=Morus notabilis TaxID=981085 RepID=W9R7I1_9ROSA|nr:hypothetical protein L484_016613 [Morus notabilis]